MGQIKAIDVFIFFQHIVVPARVGAFKTFFCVCTFWFFLWGFVFLNKSSWNYMIWCWNVSSPPVFPWSALTKIHTEESRLLPYDFAACRQISALQMISLMWACLLCTALINLLKFLLSNETTLLAKHNIFQLALLVRFLRTHLQSDRQDPRVQSTWKLISQRYVYEIFVRLEPDAVTVVLLVFQVFKGLKTQEMEKSLTGNFCRNWHSFSFISLQNFYFGLFFSCWNFPLVLVNSD